MSRRKRSGRSRVFAAMLEPLEDRIVLNVTVTGATTNTITFTSTSSSDNLALQTSSGALTYTDSSATTAQSTGFTVGKNQSIIVTEPDSGGTLNLQNVNTQGGSLTIDNDVTVTGSLNTGGGAVNISGGTVTVTGSLTTGGGALTIQNTGSGNQQGDTITVNSTFYSGSSGTLTGPGDQTFTIRSSSGTGDQATMTVAPTQGTTGSLTEGEQVTYAGSASGLTSGSTYYVNVPDSSSPTSIQLQTAISTSSSTGKAGAILLDAPTITLGPCTQLLAKGISSSSDGNITLTASYVRNDLSRAQIIDEFMNIPNHDLEAAISVESNAVINGGNVSLKATTADNNWYQAFGATGVEIATALSAFLSPVLNKLVDLPVSVQLDSATSTAEIGQSASIMGSGTVNVSTSATANATGQAMWSLAMGLLAGKFSATQGLGVSFAYDQATSTAESTVDPDATIEGTKGVSITSATTTTTSGTARVQQNTNLNSPAYNQLNLNNIQVSGAVNLLTTTSHAVVSQGATISSSAGNVAVTATASDSDKMTVETAS
ncbi:MAG: hypothetical protein ABSE84_16245, partial [Isosphaeraceae bacterium]